jgi:antirestriction protein ArdC
VSAEPRADHAQYLNGWLSALRDDKKLIVRAASLAQKAVDHISNYQSENQGGGIGRPEEESP